MWKDKVLTHVSQLDLEYQRSLLEKDQPDAKVLMKDFLLGSPAEPSAPALGLNQEDARATRWAQMHWKRAKSATQDLLNKALPNAFLSTLPDAVSKMEPWDIWKALEKIGHYKKDCPVLKSDRDPNRSGGPIFRTDVNTVPGGKRAKTGKVTKIGAVVSKTMGTPEINRAIEEDAAAAAAREMFNESDIEMSPSSELDALELTVPDTP
ncbi:hypothetical protein ATCC90586_007195 [Pythium insidiosum]|nr:hypothetical protein ATCC90586_007195 [Pythium insidiosum]